MKTLLFGGCNVTSLSMENDRSPEIIFVRDELQIMNKKNDKYKGSIQNLQKSLFQLKSHNLFVI